MIILYLKSPLEPVQRVQYVLVVRYMYTVESIGQVITEIKFTVFALPVFLQVLREFGSANETRLPFQLVSFFSSETEQHGDTQWWEMNTASYIPPQRPDLHVLRQSNKAIPLIYVSEQDIDKSIKWHIRHICICIHHCTCTRLYV